METLKTAFKTAESAVSSVATAITSDAKQKDLDIHRVEDAKEGNVITTNFGCKISHTDDSLKAGPRGPTLMEDFHFREKTTHFDHERIPERVVHARGAAAHGYFQVYQSLDEITSANFLCDPSKKTPVFVRFSTVMGSRGSADTVRDVRGFATKFYTDEGNFDLVGNNIPIFFVQDAIKFLDLVHAGKPEPHNEIPQAQTAHDNFWDFISLTPESTAMVMWALSDRAIPRSYRTMQGFGVHTFVLVNKAGKRRFVKFHWIPKLGTHSLVWDEAMKINGADPDFHRRDLWEAIENGAYPEWELGLQLVDESDEDKFDFDLLDATKIIPEELVPVQRVGKLVLNRNPDNFFAETEQVAYHTGHLVPGIEVSNDPLLQGRMFSYVDTQLTRLGGPNFEEIPINRPVCPVTNNQRDGFHRMKVNVGRVNYYPNRFGCPAVCPGEMGGYVHQPVPVSGNKIRHRGPKFYEFYSQARLFLNSLSDWEKNHLISAARFELGKVDDLGVRERMVDTFNKVDHDLAIQVALGIGVKPPTDNSQSLKHTQKSPALSQENTAKDSIQGRKVAFLIGPGFKGAQLAAAKAALTAAGGIPIVVGPAKGPVVDDVGNSVDAQFTYFTSKSVLFDAIFVVGGKSSIDTLSSIGEAMMFVCEAFKHCKAIAALDEGVDFVQSLPLPSSLKLAKSPDQGVVLDQGVITLKGFSENALSMDTTGPVTFGTTLYNTMAAHRCYHRDTTRVMA